MIITLSDIGRCTVSRNRHLKILMTQQEIAEATGRAQSYIHYILNGDRTPSMQMAEDLEKATGVCREAWLWPDRHYNPYIEFTDSKTCLGCPNRQGRLWKVGETALRYFREAEDKREAFEALPLIGKILNGHDKSTVISFREITPKGLKYLGSWGDHYGKEYIANEDLPWIIDKIRRGETIHIPHWPWDLPEDAEPERHFGFKRQVKSFLATGHGRVGFAIYSMSVPMLWTPEMIKRLESFVMELDTIWREHGS